MTQARDWGRKMLGGARPPTEARYLAALTSSWPSCCVLVGPFYAPPRHHGEVFEKRPRTSVAAFLRIFFALPNFRVGTKHHDTSPLLRHCITRRAPSFYLGGKGFLPLPPLAVPFFLVAVATDSCPPHPHTHRPQPPQASLPGVKGRKPAPQPRSQPQRTRPCFPPTTKWRPPSRRPSPRRPPLPLRPCPRWTPRPAVLW